MAFLQGFPMLNCGDEIAQRNGWDYKNDPDRVEDGINSIGLGPQGMGGKYSVMGVHLSLIHI